MQLGSAMHAQLGTPSHAPGSASHHAPLGETTHTSTQRRHVIVSHRNERQGSRAAVQDARESYSHAHSPAHAQPRTGVHRPPSHA